MAPGGPPRPQREPQDGPRRRQRDPRRPPCRSKKMPPRATQVPPKKPQGPPRDLQEAPKKHPTKTYPWGINGLQLALLLLLTPSLYPSSVSSSSSANNDASSSFVLPPHPQPHCEAPRAWTHVPRLQPHKPPTTPGAPYGVLAEGFCCFLHNSGVANLIGGLSWQRPKISMEEDIP